MITDAVEESGKTLREIATGMGLERGNVVSMLKSGEMRMPIERIPAFAVATGIDALSLTRVAMSAYIPKTWAVLAAPAAPKQEAQLNIRAPGAVVEASGELSKVNTATRPTDSGSCSPLLSALPTR